MNDEYEKRHAKLEVLSTLISNDGYFRVCDLLKHANLEDKISAAAGLVSCVTMAFYAASDALDAGMPREQLNRMMKNLIAQIDDYKPLPVEPSDDNTPKTTH